MPSSIQKAREEFERKHPSPQKLFVGSVSTNWNQKIFEDQLAAGGIQSLICYTPPNLDAVRWRLGRWWAPDGTVYDPFTFERSAGYKVYSLSPSPFWVIGSKERRSGSKHWPNPFLGRAGTDNRFSSFPNSPLGKSEYKWNDITEDCPACAGKNEKKETLIIGNNDAGGWGITSEQWWIWSVDPEQVQVDKEPSYFTYRGETLGSAFGEGGVKERIFYDHACSIELPFLKDDIEERDLGAVRELYVDINPVYNFYISSYETKISDDSIPEKILPNMYAFLLVQQEQDPEDMIVYNDEASVDDIFERHLTLNGTLADTMYTVDQKGLPLSKEVLSQKGEMTFQKSSKNQYFDKWARGYDDFDKGDDAAKLSKRFSNIIVPMSDLSLYRDFDNKKTQFPMYVDINFSTDITKTFFADALKKSQLSSVFMKDMTKSGSAFKPASDDPYNSVVIPKNYDYGPGGPQGQSTGPAVFVWWGPRWRGNGGMWTTVVNIEHDDPSSAATNFQIGDWVKVKDGVHWGNIPGHSRGFENDPRMNDPDPRVRSGYYPNHRAQIIAYSTNSKSIPQSRIPRSPGPINSYVREVYEYHGDATFYPDTPEFRDRLQEGRLPSAQAQALYGETTAIPSSRTPVDRNFFVTNTETKNTLDLKLNEWDITAWFNSFINTPAESFTTGSNNMVFMGQYNEDVEEADSSTNFYKTLMGIIFGGKFNKLVKEKTRSYQQILLGRQAHSEAVFYKVEKWAIDNDGNEVGNKPLQSIIFPNSSEIDTHHYIDTQVKYNRRYKYRIYAFVAVFGTRYRYSLDGITGTDPVSPSSHLHLRTDDQKKAEICVFTSPSVRLIQVPYAHFDGRVMDAPPIWPDVDVIQYRNHNNKVLFFFRGNVGNYKLNPIPIETADYEDLINLIEAQRLRGDDPMEFKSDDQASVFEIFRMSKKPQSYADFEDFKLAEVESDLFPDPKKSATSAAFVDDIVPNKKYYYIFRTVDIHGHTSNPTPIYEIEIVDHDGGPVLVTNVFQLKKEKDPPQMATKKAKKYIYITPNNDQLEINQFRSDLLQESGENVEIIPQSVINRGASLGIKEETVWGKKYKIRVTSKKTGRKIDFNIECKTKPWPKTTD